MKLQSERRQDFKYQPNEERKNNIGRFDMNRKTVSFASILLSFLILFSLSPFHSLSANAEKEALAEHQSGLPFEFGKPINMGPAALAAKTQGATIGDGEVYYATNGSPATFYAADSKTGKMIFSQSLPGSDVVWGMTVGADGNVYFSGTYDGILYRYLVDEQSLEQVGKNPSDNWVWQLKATADGKIYGATYPNAKVFEYDIESGDFIDLGTFYEGQLYARGLGVTDESLYVGIGTTAHLIRMDRETGERSEIELPITGASTSISNVWEYGDTLFAAYGTSLLAIDIETGEVLHTMDWEDENTFDGLLSAPSPYDESLIYFITKQATQLWTYNLETNETEKVDPTIQMPATPAKSMKWVKNEEGEDVLAILHHQIEYSEYNPNTNTLEVSYPEVATQGLNIQSLAIGDDNNVYMGGYQGSFGVFDTSTETYLLNERDPHQIEGIGFLNGEVYLGTYGGAKIYRYNPELPFEYSGGGEGNNPEMVYDIDDDQSRPFTFASGDNKLFVGTISDYGKLGGSLTIYDSLTGEWSSIRNIIENQSIIGLAYHNGIVYGGSTISGGLGIDPSEPEARMFAYDTATGEHEVFDLEAAGLDKPEMIGELSIGPDGNLWGVAWGYDADRSYNTVVFSMDKESRQVLKSTEIYSGVHRGSQWRPFYIRWDDQGYLYTTAGRKLTVINPDTMASKQLISSNVDLMDLDDEGNIYFASGADLYKLPVPMEEAIISAENESILQGQQLKPELEIILQNGKSADLASAEVHWFSSDTDIISIEEGMITGINGGNAEIQATVTYNGEQITTNILLINVNVTTESLAMQIDAFKEDGQLQHSTAKQLNNSLRQADHHYGKGHLNQVLKQLEKFRKQLRDSTAETSVKEALLSNVDIIEDSYRD